MMLPYIYILMLPNTLGKPVIPDWMETSEIMTPDGDILNSNSFFGNANGSSVATLVDESDMSGEEEYDFACAIENKRRITTQFPGWNRQVNTHEKQAIPYSWEPILEPIVGCNGLADGHVRKPNYVFVLDETWNRMYQKYSKFFKIQGYNSLLESPYILIDRANYLLGKQFGVQIIASKVVDLPDLKNACDKRKGNTQDSTPETDTLLALKNAGEELPESSAGFVRLSSGTNFPCRSLGAFTTLPCRFKAGITLNLKIFDDIGRLYTGAASTLAHELMHSYGICPRDRMECDHGHTRNDIPDIMVWNGDPAKENGVGHLRKFLTTCAPYIYGDFVCGIIKDRLNECSVEAPLTEPERTNIAVGKFPWQSSTCSEGDASRAVDGNTNGSVASTCNEVNNWWKLTFRPNTLVKNVVIWGSELENVLVQIYDKGEVVASRTLSNESEENNFFIENEVRADFIKISTENKALKLAEVQVFGYEPAGEQAVEVGKSAMQSSTCNGGVASRAVDGNANARDRGSTAHTCNDPVNWWKVKLAPNTLVNEVRFVYLYDKTQDMLREGVLAEIYDGDNVVATTNGLIRGLQHYEFMFGLKKQVKADSIKLSLAGTPINLGEVQVFGYEPTFWNIVKDKRPEQSSTTWEVKLRPGSQVYEVVIWNTMDHKHWHHLKDAVITIYKAGNEIASKQLSNVSHHEHRYSLSLENKMDADYININSMSSLNLEKVEVYGTESPSWILWDGLTFQNIAKGKHASQSTTCHGGEASRAVDGNTNGDWRKNSVTHTCDKGDNWWKVKLRPGSEVYKVVVWNRTGCCMKLKGATLQIIKDDEVVASKMFHHELKPSDSLVLEKGTKADYVKVISKKVITLAEVEVFGTE